MPTCDARVRENKCNQEAGHDGPHGYDLGGGMILAPFRGGTQTSSEQSELPCDCCGTPLLLYRETGTFECPNPECRQDHIFSKDGSHSSSVIARLYPAWDGMNAALKEEYLSYAICQGVFSLKARLLLGYITSQEFEAGTAKLNDQAAELRATIRPGRFQRFFKSIRRL
jgi:hypothetical protein